jgi:L-fuculose-phosphate aldolase
MVNLDGRRLSPGEPSRELLLHLEIYSRFPDVCAIVHTHSPWATAWSHLHAALPGGTEEMSYHDIDAIPCARAQAAGSQALADSACRELERTPVALLGGHGVVAVGRSATEAFELCALAEQQAQVRWLLRLGDERQAARVDGSEFQLAHAQSSGHW